MRAPRLIVAALLLAGCSSSHAPVGDPPDPPACEPGTLGWRFDALPIAGDVGFRPSLAVDERGRRHLAFVDRTGRRLSYAVEGDDGLWSNEVLAETADAEDHALAIGPGGPVVLISSRAGLRLIELRSGGRHDIVTLVEGPAMFPRIAVAGESLHVLYSDFRESGGGFGVATGGLRHGVISADGFSTRPVADGWGAGEMAVFGDTVYVVHTIAGSLTLAEARADGPFASRILRSEPDHRAAVVDVSDEGTVRIAARRGPSEIVLLAPDRVMSVGSELSNEIALEDGRLVFSTRDGRVFVDDVTDPDEAPEELASGRNTVGRIAVAGRDHVAFYDWNQGRAVIAHRGTDCADGIVLERPAGFSREVIDSGRDWPSPPRRADVAVTTHDGVAHVAYAFQNGACCADVHYATDATGRWESSPIGGESDRSGTSVAIEHVGGAPQVAFSSPDGLSLASKNGGAWTVELVDPEHRLGTPALAGRDGRVELVYGAGSELRHARFEGGRWTISVIDPGEETHLLANVSAGVDAAEALHVSYTDHYGELRYATDASGTWAIETVDDTWGATAIDVRPDGTVRIAYVTGSELRAAVRDASGWRIVPLGHAGTLIQGLASVVVDGDVFVTAHAGWPLRGVTQSELSPTGAIERWLVALDASDAVVAGVDARQVVYFDQGSGALVRATRR